MIRTFMGAFGADTPKLTLLVGTAPFLGELQRGLRPSDRQRIQNLGVSLVVRSSSGTVSGSKHLKATQSYPLGFGSAVGIAFARGFGPVQHVRGGFGPEQQPPRRSADSGDAARWLRTPGWFLEGVLEGRDDAWQEPSSREHALPLLR
ncbi:MAG: hypothetical protein GY772_01835 [bacterium]|nr:hypothetical protein [bacterium]